MLRNYTLSNNFQEFNESVKIYLERLTQNSIQYFSKQISDGKILKNNSTYENPKYIREFSKMQSFIKNVEEYLYYYYSKDNKNFWNVFCSIKQLQAISVLDDSDRGIYGVTYPSINVVQINPNLKGNAALSPEQRTRLYVCHELGHMANDKWMTTIRNHLMVTNYTPSQKQLIYDGFSLIDEATTQNRAEDIAYFYANKKRPHIAFYSDSRGMYAGDSYKTNFDFYRELQEPATIFARTLRGIGKIDNDSEALALLSRRTLNPNFVNSVVNEYKRDGQITNLYNELQYLGFLKNASYARFGYASRDYLPLSKAYFQKFKYIASQLRDYREPYNDYQQ